MPRNEAWVYHPIDRKPMGGLPVKERGTFKREGQGGAEGFQSAARTPLGPSF